MQKKLVHFLEVPALGIIETWRYINEIEQLECCTHRNIMLYSIAPVLHQVRLEHLVFFGADAVAELSFV